jgi:hypothetical protein
MNPLTAENAALRSLCAELVGALEGVVHVKGTPLSREQTKVRDDNFDRARAALAHAKELLK